MKNFYILLTLTLFPFLLAYSQKAKISGVVTDFKTKETLVGVNIIIGSKVIATDEKGFYSVELDPDRYTIEYKLMGYASKKRIEKFKANEVVEMNIRLEEDLKQLDEFVVSAGKFEQKLEDVTVSMDIIKASMIENTNTQNVTTVLQQAPGMMIMDKQASIRGGSSYSYGAGSRVLMMVDDLPMLGGASGVAYWEFVPVENIDQIEIIKGASSALYGSSALNGVVNIRTKYPKMEPETKFMFTAGCYGNPEREAAKWWGNTQPIFAGTQFLHSRMIGNFDLVVGGNVYSDNGYRQGDNGQLARLNFNTRWRNAKVKGLTYGVNFNYMKWDGGKFMMWMDGDSGIYKLSPSFNNYRVFNTRMNVDPFLTYFTAKGNRHSLKTRLFNTLNRNSTNQKNDDYLYYGEYQFQRYLEGNLTWTSGVTGTYYESIAEIYGDEKHYGASGAVYSQIDKKLKKFNASVGVRWESYRMDKDKSDSRPVFRTGLNYKMFEHTNIRASFGQGFRYPTISEKYVRTSAGQLNIFPNDTLKPEKGWSAEIGFKQGFKLSNLKGYIDVAGFWTEYYDMIEFGFGYHFPYVATFYPPDTVFKYLGFKSYNVSNAQITGVDVTIAGQGKLFGLPIALMAGYTFTNPVDLNIKPEDRDKTTARNDMLKYRFYHSAKADAEVTVRKINIGFSLNFNSFIVNIDKAFEDSLRFPNGNPIIFNGQPMFILKGLKEYRAAHNKGQVAFDARLGLDLSEKSRISVVVRNVFNKEYMIRPADVQAPRTFALQYMLKL